MNAMTTALTGVAASELRLSVSAANVANMNSAGATPAAQQAQTPNPAPQPYQPARVQQTAQPGGGVEAHVTRNPGNILIYQPSSPYADAEGMIAIPDIDPAQEHVEQVAAKQAFEANIRIIKVADDMQRRLIDQLA